MKTWKVKNDKQLKSVMKQIEKATNELYEEAQNKGVWAVTSEALKDSNKYIPFDTGHLLRSGTFGTTFTTGKIEYNAPYGRRLYYNPTFNFSKDTNPQASAYWFEKGTRSNIQKYRKIYITLWEETKKEVF